MAVYSLDGVEPNRKAGFSWIAPSASVIGNVVVGIDVGIWFGAAIRGDNEPITIGNRTNIQENCVIHTDPGFPVVIGEGCTVGHKAILHGCVIGENSLIGMGATVLNGATIGKNCLIGAGALITEGKTIPDNSLVMGVPGKVIRELDEHAIAGLRSSADIYVANAKRFAKSLLEV